MKKLFTHTNKNIFIAGHSGLAGSAIERRLMKVNCNILKVPHSELDLTIQKDVFEWFEEHKPDAVYLAAATAGGIHANYERPAEFIYNNLQIQNNIIHASHINNVQKLCFLGSSCIYPRLADQPMKEDALLTGPLDKHNIWYAVAKIAGLMMVDGYSKQYGSKFISLSFVDEICGLLFVLLVVVPLALACQPYLYLQQMQGLPLILLLL